MSNYKVAIIVVTYNPDVNALLKNINTYINQSSLVIFIDNSDDNTIKNRIFEVIGCLENTVLIQLPENTGIANAQNIGIGFANDHGYEFYIEMDQDTQLPDDYVQNMIESFISIRDEGHKIAGIGPIALNMETENPYHGRSENRGVIGVSQTLSSGFLSSVNVFNDVGYKNTGFFIDYVDWEWCWRAQRKGYKVYVNTNIPVLHALGIGHKQILSFQVGIPSPIRHYYQYRNSLYLIFGNIAPVPWKIKRFIIHLIKPFFYLALPDSFLRIKYLSKGIIDFCLDKRGKYK